MLRIDYLDSNGNASIGALDVNNGSIGTNVQYQLSKSNFDCGDLGENLVDFTVSNDMSNSSTQVLITVLDEIKPIAKARNIEVMLDESGSAKIAVSQVDAGCTDNCTIESIVIDKDSFTCENIGDNEVILTVIDNSGNMSSTNANVKILDGVRPEIVTKDVELYIDANGMAVLSELEVIQSVSDNCQIAETSLDVSEFTCEDLGNNQIEITAVDINGNTTIERANVLVMDTIAPVISLKNIEVDLQGEEQITISAEDFDDGSYDNCSLNLSLDKENFDNIGEYEITIIAEDNAGHIVTAKAVVNVINTALSVDSREGIGVFPNPTSDFINVTFNKNFEKISIHDIYGNKVLESYSKRIDLQNLADGKYFVRVFSNGNYHTLDFIKY